MVEFVAIKGASEGAKGLGAGNSVIGKGFSWTADVIKTAANALPTLYQDFSTVKRVGTTAVDFKQLEAQGIINTSKIADLKTNLLKTQLAQTGDQLAAIQSQKIKNLQTKYDQKIQVKKQAQQKQLTKQLVKYQKKIKPVPGSDLARDNEQYNTALKSVQDFDKQNAVKKAAALATAKEYLRIRSAGHTLQDELNGKTPPQHAAMQFARDKPILGLFDDKLDMKTFEKNYNAEAREAYLGRRQTLREVEESKEKNLNRMDEEHKELVRSKVEGDNKMEIENIEKERDTEIGKIQEKPLENFGSIKWSKRLRIIPQAINKQLFKGTQNVGKQLRTLKNAEDHAKSTKYSSEEVNKLYQQKLYEAANTQAKILDEVKGFKNIPWIDAGSKWSSLFANIGNRFKMIYHNLRYYWRNWARLTDEGLTQHVGATNNLIRSVFNPLLPGLVEEPSWIQMSRMAEHADDMVIEPFSEQEGRPNLKRLLEYQLPQSGEWTAGYGLGKTKIDSLRNKVKDFKNQKERDTEAKIVEIRKGFSEATSAKIVAQQTEFANQVASMANAALKLEWDMKLNSAHAQLEMQQALADHLNKSETLQSQVDNLKITHDQFVSETGSLKQELVRKQGEINLKEEQGRNQIEQLRQQHLHEQQLLEESSKRELEKAQLANDQKIRDIETEKKVEQEKLLKECESKIKLEEQKAKAEESNFLMERNLIKQQMEEAKKEVDKTRAEAQAELADERKKFEQKQKEVQTHIDDIKAKNLETGKKVTEEMQKVRDENAAFKANIEIERSNVAAANKRIEEINVQATKDIEANRAELALQLKLEQQKIAAADERIKELDKNHAKEKTLLAEQLKTERVRSLTADRAAEEAKTELEERLVRQMEHYALNEKRLVAYNDLKLRKLEEQLESQKKEFEEHEKASKALSNSEAERILWKELAELDSKHSRVISEMKADKERLLTSREAIRSQSVTLQEEVKALKDENKRLVDNHLKATTAVKTDMKKEFKDYLETMDKSQKTHALKMQEQLELMLSKSQDAPAKLQALQQSILQDEAKLQQQAVQLMESQQKNAERIQKQMLTWNLFDKTELLLNQGKVTKEGFEFINKTYPANEREGMVQAIEAQYDFEEKAYKLFNALVEDNLIDPDSTVIHKRALEFIKEHYPENLRQPLIDSVKQQSRLQQIYQYSARDSNLTIHNAD